MAVKNKYTLYKGKPLVRSGNTLYYGDPREAFVIRLQILDSEAQKTAEEDLNVATKVQIYLISTDKTLSLEDTIIKSSERKGLYDAMDFADVWLERAIRDSQK